MRICHLSDSHLGAGENYPVRGDHGLTLRQEDFVAAFTSAIDRIISLKPDLCLHAGDIFHVVRPSNRIMAIVGEQLARLCQDAGIPLVIITGNHDAPRQAHVTAALEVYRPLRNLHIAAGAEVGIFEIGDCRICAVPHSFTGPDQRSQLSGCFPDTNRKYNVLVMHGVAAGMPQFAMAELGEQEIPLEATTGFDYTALGHYHNFCQVGPRVYYAGSTERLSQAERVSAKGFVEVQLDPFVMKFHELQVREMVDIPRIDAQQMRGSDLVAEIERRVTDREGENKIVRVTVTGMTEATLRTIPSQAVAELRRRVFDLDIRYVREASESMPTPMGREAIGGMDDAWSEFLTVTELEGFDRGRLLKDGMLYLRADD